MAFGRLTACSLIAASLLAGCAALPGGGPKPLDTYELSAPSLPERPSRGRTQILVADPSALQILDSQNIVISPAPGSLEYLGGAQWADRLPRVVQARLVETFQNASGFNGVGRPGQGLAIDYQLIVEVRRFEIAVNGGRSARVAFAVKLLNDRNGTVRAVRDFEATAPVSGTTNAAYVAALNSAFGEVAGEMVDWTRSRI